MKRKRKQMLDFKHSHLKYAPSKSQSGFDGTNSIVYQQIVQLIQQQKFQAALSITRQFSNRRFENLTAVILMRTGKPQEAVSILRRLAVDPISLEFRPGMPLVYKINFLTALFMSGQVAGCLQLLQDLPSEMPQVNNLLRNVKRWEQSLSFWKWVDWRIFRIEHHDTSITLDFEPGEFEDIVPSQAA